MQKQMKSLFTTMLAIGLFCQSQAADLFTPVQKTELRAPSVPLITSDPYLSIWSPYDKLNEGSTEHWTGTEHPLIGAVRVDGKVYRFMGKQTLEAKMKYGKVTTPSNNPPETGQTSNTMPTVGKPEKQLSEVQTDL